MVPKIFYVGHKVDTLEFHFLAMQCLQMVMRWHLTLFAGLALALSFSYWIPTLQTNYKHLIQILLVNSIEY